jgi:Tripartite tricarboxylate transporter TctA family
VLFGPTVRGLGLAPALALVSAFASRRMPVPLAVGLSITTFRVLVFRYACRFGSSDRGWAPDATSMELFAHPGLSFETAFKPINIVFCFIGVLLGTLIGVLPGNGPHATSAMLLPLTLALSPATSLIMLAGIYYGAQYGGSTTANLVNVPGRALARQGHPLAPRLADQRRGDR